MKTDDRQPCIRHALALVPIPLTLLDPAENWKLRLPALVGIHVGTCLVAGFHDMGWSEAACLRCLANCLMPKACWLPKSGSKEQNWPVHGRFDELLLPAGVLPTAIPQLASVCRELGIDCHRLAMGREFDIRVQKAAQSVANRVELEFALDSGDLPLAPNEIPDLYPRLSSAAFGSGEALCESQKLWAEYVASYGPCQQLPPPGELIGRFNRAALDAQIG